MLVIKNRSISGILFLLFLAGYASPLSAQESFPFTAVSMASQVRVRAGQSQNFEDLASLRDTEEVVVVDKNYSWYKIRLPAHARSFVSQKFIKILGDGVGQMTGDQVNVRARASAGSSVVGQLNRGDLVRIVNGPVKINDKETGDWFQIEPPGESYGWVREDFLRFKSKEVPAAAVVELPVKNIYKRKNLAAGKIPENLATSSKTTSSQSPEAGQVSIPPVTAAGIIESLGDKSLAQNIRHQISVESGGIYFLKGYRSMLDCFLNYKVRIEGQVLSDIKAPQPVILVTKVQLIL